MIAVNVLGMETELMAVENVSNPVPNERLRAIFNDADYSSPYDDLSFEMYVDTEVVKMVKDMEMKKHLAVLGKYYISLSKHVTLSFVLDTRRDIKLNVSINKSISFQIFMTSKLRSRF